MTQCVQRLILAVTVIPSPLAFCLWDRIVPWGHPNDVLGLAFGEEIGTGTGFCLAVLRRGNRAGNREGNSHPSCNLLPPFCHPSLR